MARDVFANGARKLTLKCNWSMSKTPTEGSNNCERVSERGRERERERERERAGSGRCNMNGYYNFHTFVRGIKLPFTGYYGDDTEGT